MSNAKDALPEPHPEWAVEITWVDWKDAGCSDAEPRVYGAFDDLESACRYQDSTRLNRAIASTRIVSRFVAFTEWRGGDPVPAPDEAERERLFMALFDRP